MIRVKITKKILTQGKGVNMLGMTISAKQIIAAVIALSAGLGEYVLLKNILGLDAVMSVIFITLFVIIAFGAVNIQGLTLLRFILLAFRGVDKRPYQSKGVYNKNVDENIF